MREKNERRTKYNQNFVDFREIDLTRISHILELNNEPRGITELVKVAIEIVDKMSYSEDFESLTGFKR